MSPTADLLESIRASAAAPTLAEMLAAHLGIARRTAQRSISTLIERDHWMRHDLHRMGLPPFTGSDN